MTSTSLRERATARRSIIALAASLTCLPLSSQETFRDDAGREVPLPAQVQRTFAAGAPAEVLLYTLAPEKLAGRNMRLSAAALELVPVPLRDTVAIVNLPERDDPRYDAELLALDVDLYVDYGTVDSDYVEALEAISARTGIPAVILDGRLASIPSVYLRLGAALGVTERGARLAEEAERLLAKYGGALAQSAPRVYLACSQNGLTPCYRGQAAAEAVATLGAINVAGELADAPRRPLTHAEIEALAPDAIVAANADAAAALRADPAWRALPAVAAGRVHAFPALPYSWGARPPSVNRLAGLIWLAYVLPGRPFDDEFYAETSRFFAAFYHVSPTRAQLRELVGAAR